MKKTILGVALVVVFCITWWLVAGEALQIAQQAEQARQQAQQAYEPAKQASIDTDAHFRTQGSWGIGAGLLADVLVLVGALAWSKVTAKA